MIVANENEVENTIALSIPHIRSEVEEKTKEERNDEKTDLSLQKLIAK
jgi:hypothetical protein